MAGLYLHIPFCEHKCIYCDFYSIAPTEERLDGDSMMTAFTGSLLTEIDLRVAALPASLTFDSVFFGGGTPSLLQPRLLSSILERLNQRFDVSKDAEITMEANPGTVSAGRLRDFRSAGINRISFGVQSFHDEDLRFLTRIHTAQQAIASIRDARNAGFENLNIDLMFSLPGQTVDGWMKTLDTALKLAPTHLSCYSLIVEPNTPLHRMVRSRQVTLLDTETDATLYEMTIDTMNKQGFEQYEVSNFSRAGYRSRHNTTYWRHGEYIGFGPSAHSYRDGVRWWNIANISTYSAKINERRLPVAGEERLTEDQIATETVYLALRSDGLDVAEFNRRFGRSFLDEFGNHVADLLDHGLMRRTGEHLALTPQGYLICDEICGSLIRETAATH